MKIINIQLHCRGRRGLTLGEMLIVLAVFSILAIMFIVSSQDAIEKSRYSRVLQEQRNIVSALEEYIGKYGTVPPENQGLEALVGRTAFVPSVPRDLFAEESVSQYLYVPDEHHTLIISVGPDGDLDAKATIDKMRGDQVALAGNRKILFRTADQARDFIARHRYDPTNGTKSDGDVISYYQH